MFTLVINKLATLALTVVSLFSFQCIIQVHSVSKLYVYDLVPGQRLNEV